MTTRTAATGGAGLWAVVVPIFGPSVLFGMTEGAIFPVVALTAIDRGASTAVAALIAALVGVGSILSNIPASRLAERFGERRAMLAGSGVSVAGLLLCLAGGGLLPLAAGVLLLGVASSVFQLARQMYLTAAAPLHLRARALSTLGGSIRIGVFVGPFLGAAAMRVWGLAAAYWVAIATVCLAGIVAARVPDLEAPGQARAAPSTVTTRELLRGHGRTFATVGLGVTILSAIRQSRQVVIPLWAHHIGLDPATTSIVYGLSGGLDALVFYPGGLMMDRFGRKVAAVPCLTILSLSFLVLPATHGPVTLTLVSLLMGLGNGLGSGIIMTLGADTAPSVARALYLGIWGELADVGSGGGPLLLSGLTAAASLGLSIIVQGGLGLVGAAVFLRWVANRPTPDPVT